ncbi:MAG: septum formation initiator family protein [Holosporaceae bacterium]|jgi:cell division protein FtsB|nr:septum formation initiator family protein [Holosporaceae bacterium]
MSLYPISLRKSFRLIASNVVWIFIAGYFIFHIFVGARGTVSWAKLSKEVETLEEELRELKEENDFLENKINFMRSDNLDLDLLEEEAQNSLGFSYDNDIIVLLPRGE